MYNVPCVSQFLFPGTRPFRDGGNSPQLHRDLWELKDYRNMLMSPSNKTKAELEMVIYLPDVAFDDSRHVVEMTASLKLHWNDPRSSVFACWRIHEFHFSIISPDFRLHL
jgi:hypothetical protein